jgi:CubicO group peptidase (beta-lactamase class C family)
MVVDLWSSTPSDIRQVKRKVPYGPDTTACIYSSGKLVADLVFAVLVDQCLVSYDDKVSKHWPEFAQNGKQDINVGECLRNEVMIHKLEIKIDLEHAFTENIK